MHVHAVKKGKETSGTKITLSEPPSVGIRPLCSDIAFCGILNLKRQRYVLRKPQHYNTTAEHAVLRRKAVRKQPHKDYAHLILRMRLSVPTDCA